MEAVKWLRKAAENGDAGALEMLGRRYYVGMGEEKNLDKAVGLWSQAAAKGSSAAQFQLAHCYGSGEGVPKDIRKAVSLFRQAAEAGHAEAQLQMGCLYQDDTTDGGAPKNPVEACKWFSLAAAQGAAGAAKGQSDIEKIMTPEQIAEAQKLSREWKPKTAK
jgi:uncharacterized protein